MKSALLFYKKLWGDLKQYGFVLNRYDCCIVNKFVNGTILTILWHFDDLKISHINKAVVDHTIEWLRGIYGEICVSRGLVHDYLGMDLDYSEKGKVKISMVNFLKKCVSDFPEVITGGAPTPATDRLFDVRPKHEQRLLEEEHAIAFHHSVAQLLFAAIRFRRDI